jgi:uncharacterized membrane protein (UPF0127 family)
VRGRTLTFALVALGACAVVLLAVGVLLGLGVDRGDDDDAEVIAPVGFGVETTPVAADAEPEFARAFSQVQIAIGAVDGGPCVDLLVADTPALRNQGLREVDDLGEWDGMLFVRPEPVASVFTMADTAMDLSIGWYDVDGHLLGTSDMFVCEGSDSTCPTYPSPGPWSYAVEYPLGTLPPGDLSRC